jgi:coatomer protein complex subunit gamma
LEDLEVTVSDHVQKVVKPNFAASWEEVGEANELEDTYALSSMKSIDGKDRDLIINNNSQHFILDCTMMFWCS